MKCPYRKSTTRIKTPLRTKISESYEECYKEDCPLYVKLQKGGCCVRADSESFRGTER